jgi:hypothetical protein
LVLVLIGVVDEYIVTPSFFCVVDGFTVETFDGGSILLLLPLVCRLIIADGSCELILVILLENLGVFALWETIDLVATDGNEFFDDFLAGLFVDTDSISVLYIVVEVGRKVVEKPVGITVENFNVSLDIKKDLFDGGIIKGSFIVVNFL